MGKYAVYVWSSVGLTLLVLALNLWSAATALRQAQQSARRGAGHGAGAEGGR
jgi:heme exporter protein CcmD